MSTAKLQTARLRLTMSSTHWAWVYLALAVMAEVIGLTAMKVSMARGSVLGHLLLYVLVGVSYVLLAKAVRNISIGVAYAIWEGSGIALITLVSWLAFAHALSTRELIGIGLAVLGIVLVNAGQVHEPVNQVNTALPPESLI